MIVSRNPTLEVIDGSVITRAFRGAWVAGYEDPETPGVPGYHKGSIVRVDAADGMWSLHVSLFNNNIASPVTAGQNTWFEIAKATIATGGTVINGMSVVVHGSNGNAPRPDGASAVYWQGAVEPLNRLPGDLWFDTSMV